MTASWAARPDRVGRLAGTRADFDFDEHARRRITYVGVTFRTRTREEIACAVRAMLADLREPLAAGRLDVPIAGRFALEEVSRAYELRRADAQVGKYLLRIR